jgi:hypothetical protein
MIRPPPPSSKAWHEHRYAKIPINYYTSEIAFTDMAQRVIDLGVTAIGLYYLVLDEQCWSLSTSRVMSFPS